MLADMQTAPLYAKIKRHILDLIQAGELKPNDKIPSENALVKQFGVSRMTVNRALRELKDAGIVERVSGVGTFISDLGPKGHLIAVNNIAEEIRDRGHNHSAQVIQNKLEGAPPEVAFQMRIDHGSSVFHSVIVHLEDGVPIQLEDRYVSSLILPDYGDVDFSKTTPNEYLMAKAPLQKFEHRVRAVLPNEEMQRLLKIDSDEPCLLLVRRTWSNQAVVSYTHMTHPGSRFEFMDSHKPDS